MTVSVILWAGWFFAIPPLATYAGCGLARVPPGSAAFFAGWLVSALGGGMYALLAGSALAAAEAGASALLALYLWWRSKRPRRKKASRSLSAEAWARVKAMVRNMPRPGPVLRPVPHPA